MFKSYLIVLVIKIKREDKKRDHLIELEEVSYRMTHSRSTIISCQTCVHFANRCRGHLVKVQGRNLRKFVMFNLYKNFYA